MAVHTFIKRITTVSTLDLTSLTWMPSRCNCSMAYTTLRTYERNRIVGFERAFAAFDRFTRGAAPDPIGRSRLHPIGPGGVIEREDLPAVRLRITAQRNVMKPTSALNRSRRT
jgi:hypothetical protein